MISHSAWGELPGLALKLNYTVMGHWFVAVLSTQVKKLFFANVGVFYLLNEANEYFRELAVKAIFVVN